MSVTKSFTSLAFGMARAKGFFPDLDANLDNTLPVPASKRDITLQHLLTMRSGIDVDNDRFGEEIVMGERQGSRSGSSHSRPLRARNAVRLPGLRSATARRSDPERDRKVGGALDSGRTIRAASPSTTSTGNTTPTASRSPRTGSGSARAISRSSLNSFASAAISRATS